MLQQLWICVKKILLNLTWKEFVLMDLSKELMEFVFFYGFQHCNVSVFPVSVPFLPHLIEARECK